MAARQLEAGLVVVGARVSRQTVRRFGVTRARVKWSSPVAVFTVG
jgi:hypothetical protein